jgi:hypothetical protein
MALFDWSTSLSRRSPGGGAVGLFTCQSVKENCRTGGAGIGAPVGVITFKFAPFAWAGGRQITDTGHQNKAFRPCVGWNVLGVE